MEMEEKVKEVLKTVIDPELGVNIVDLGLIYEIVCERLESGEDDCRVTIRMTLTSPGCPLAPIIDQMVKSCVGEVDCVKKIELDLVWDPPWVPSMMSEELKADFGIED